MLWAVLAIVAVASIAVDANAAETTPAAAAAAAPQPTSLLQAGSQTYSAARARASLHAGEHASASRFHSTLHRAGVAGPSARTAGRQDHSRAHQSQVMLDIVEKVLAASDAHEAVAPLSAGGADPAAEAASEFHLLNSLMEAQSSLREHGAHSNEKQKIGGVDRQYLQAVTDQAVANALRLVAKEHPSKPMHALTEPLHLYGVRKLWNNAKDDAAEHMQHDTSATSLYSAEALADPYLSRNTHMDSLAETNAFAHRISPQLVYQLSDKDKAMLAQREQIRNKEYAARHKAHQQRRNSPTPKPSHLRRQAPVHRRAAPAQTKRAAHSIPVPHAAASAASPAAAAGYPGAFLEQSVEVEIDDAAAFESLHEQYLAELDAAEQGEQIANLKDSRVAQEPMEQLLRRFAPAPADADDETMMVELESQLRDGQKQMPLRELGILLGLNPNKKNAPAPAAPAAAAPVAQAQAPAQPAAAAPAAKAAAPASMRFAQHRAGARSRNEGEEVAAEAPTEEGAGGGEAPAEGGAEAGAGGAGGDDSFEAMVNAGEEYQPSSLKHPPPPPLPPPPPPPAPPKFE